MKKKHIIIIASLLFVGVLFFLFGFFISSYDAIKFMLSDPRRAKNFWNVFGKIVFDNGIDLIALIVAALMITMSTIVFQTLTSNRIITPSLLGMDSIYAVIQTTLVFFFTNSLGLIKNPIMNFFLSVIIMCLFTIGLQTILIKRHKRDILLLLLVGMVINTLASNYSSFIQMVMDPDQFQQVFDLTTASLTNIDSTLIYVVLPIVVMLSFLFYRQNNELDVMALGEYQSTNLGVQYNKKIYYNLVLISVAVAITTALVGPLSFLGLLCVNAAREMSSSYKHKYIFILSTLFAIGFLIYGTLILDFLNLKITLMTLINIIGGIYMIRLIVKEHQV